MGLTSGEPQMSAISRILFLDFFLFGTTGIQLIFKMIGQYSKLKSNLIFKITLRSFMYCFHAPENLRGLLPFLVSASVGRRQLIQIPGMSCCYRAVFLM